MTQLNPRCDKQHLSLPRFQPQRASWQMSFLLNACIIYFTLLQGTTYSSNAEQFYVTYAPYVSLTYPHQASVPVVPVHSSAQAAASSSELPRSLIAAQSRSQKPRGSNVRPQRHSAPRFCAMLLCHASVPCFRATSGPLQGHIVKGFDKGTSYGAACSMPSDWVTRNPLLQKEAATSRKISFFLCLMPSDRQDLNHSRHKHQLSMT